MENEGYHGSFGGHQTQGTGFDSGAVFKIAYTIANKMSAQDIAIADHEGQLKSFSGLVAAIQSSLSAWQNVAIGVAGVIGVVVAILAGFQAASFSEISSLRTDTKAQIGVATGSIDKVSQRLESIESKQRTLPAEISQQLLNTASTIVTIHEDRASKRP